MKTLLLGLGAPQEAGDPAVGRIVAQRLAARGCPATIFLVDDELSPEPDWAGHDRVVIVQAVADGRTPGTVHRAERHAPPGAPTVLLGDHGDVIQKVLERVDDPPPHLEVFSVVIPVDAHGEQMSPLVAAAADWLVAELDEKLCGARDHARSRAATQRRAA